LGVRDLKAYPCKHPLTPSPAERGGSIPARRLECPTPAAVRAGLSVVLGAGATFGPTSQEPDRTHGYANHQQCADAQGATTQIGSRFFFG